MTATSRVLCGVPFRAATGLILYMTLPSLLATFTPRSIHVDALLSSFETPG